MKNCTCDEMDDFEIKENGGGCDWCMRQQYLAERDDAMLRVMDGDF